MDIAVTGINQYENSSVIFEIRRFNINNQLKPVLISAKKNIFFKKNICFKHKFTHNISKKCGTFQINDFVAKNFNSTVMRISKDHSSIAMIIDGCKG